MLYLKTEDVIMCCLVKAIVHEGEVMDEYEEIVQGLAGEKTYSRDTSSTMTLT
jgi:hypothetical protein